MKSGTKKTLIAAVVLMLVVVLIIWYAQTRQTHFQATSLTRIDYTPPTLGSKGPYLVYTFAQPLPASSITGTSAVLKSFVLGASSPTTGPTAQSFIAQLVDGVPFVPEVSAGRAILTTNTLPANMPATRISVAGTGTMWFVPPK